MTLKLSERRCYREKQPTGRGGCIETFNHAIELSARRLNLINAIQ